MMERNWTTGSVFKNIVCFSLPFFLSYFLQILYGMADLFIIGQFGKVADTTAVSIGSQVMHMLTVMIVGLAMGSAVMIGRAVGENARDKVAASVGNTVTLFMSLSAVVTVLLIILIKPIIAALSAPEEAVCGAYDYLFVCFIGIPFITAYNIIAAILRGLGDTKSPLRFIAVACVCNIALDYLFIGAFHLGPLGAALGTTISQTASVIFATVQIIKKNVGLKPKRRDFRLNRTTAGGILKIGLPVAFQDGFIQITFIIVTVFANRRGLDDSAAVGIVEKIIGILFLVPSSMLSSVSALSAQNLGAGKNKRATDTVLYAILISVSFGTVSSLLVFFVAEPIVALFTESGNVVRLGSQYLRGYIWDCIFSGVHFCFSGYFCAKRKSFLSFMHHAVSILYVRIPFSYFAATHFPDSLFPMGCASPLGSLLSVIICVIAFIFLSRSEKKEIADN